MAFSLVGSEASTAGDTLHVTTIEIRRGAEVSPFQIIEGLTTKTPIRGGTPDFSSIDMNFDGYGDIRLVEFLPAGPNVPYLNWLFDPRSGRFVEHTGLNALASPQFDAKTREIRSEWRAGPALYGVDVYVFRDGALTPVRRERKEYTAPGRYTLQVLQRVDGDWKVVEKRDVREP